MKRTLITLSALALTTVSLPSLAQQSYQIEPPLIAHIECNPRQDQCSIQTREGEMYYLDRGILPYFITFDEESDDCYMELCYRQNGSVSGLNPEYTFYPNR